MNSIRTLLIGLGLFTTASLYGQTASSQDSLSSIQIELASGQVEPLALNATDMRAVRSLSEAQLAAFVLALDATPLTAFDQLPRKGQAATFYSLQHPDWPPLPANTSQSGVWKMNDFYLLDDVNYDYNAPVKSRTGMQAMTLSGPPSPGSGSGGGTNGYFPNGSSYTPPDYGTNLYIAKVSLTNGYLTGIASNTLAGVSYEILTNADIGTTNWSSSGLFVFGSEATNWTAFTALPVSRTNGLFLRLRSWASNDGSGLPIWWEQEYGVTDPYGDPDADGWNNLQEFQNGTSPLVFDQPPAPQGLTVNYDALNSTATLHWLPSPGPVTGYTVTDSANNSYQVSAGAITFQNIVAPTVDGYSVVANYGQGDSSASLVSLHPNPPEFTFINDAHGRVNLVLFNPPADLVSVKIHRVSQQGSTYMDGTLVQIWPDVGSASDYPTDLADGDFIMPAADFTNGLAVLPTSQMFNFGSYYFSVQTLGSNGLSSTIWGGGYADNNVFVDGRAQLKDNLRFRLRAATDNGPFETFQSLEPTNYVYAGIYNYNISVPPLSPVLPFWENINFKNFLFDGNNLLTPNIRTYGDYGPITSASVGMPNTGVYYENPYDFDGDGNIVHTDIGLSPTPMWQADFAGFITTNGLPPAPASVLAGSLSQWILPNYDNTIFGWLYPGYQNFYGLTCESQMSVVYTNNQFISTTQTPGANPPGSPAMAYYNSAQPVFQTD